jgi:two-component system response regulator ChvI
MLPKMAEAATTSRRERISVLLVDDDDNFREAAEMELAHLGFDVNPLASGDEMVDFFASGNRCDAIVLDWKLPRRSGIDYLRALRRRNVTTPVIILTGMPEADYESEALDDGADDFVDKARGLCILAKRVRRIVACRNMPASTPGSDIQSGKLLLRTAANRAFWNGIDLNLTVTEFNILRLMVTQADEHVTYRAIYDCVHHPGFIAGNGEDGYRTNVRSAVKRIRNKFRAIEPNFAQIENFSSFGYRWCEDEPAATQYAHRANGHDSGMEFAVAQARLGP